MATASRPKKGHCIKFKLLGDCDHGAGCTFRHEFILPLHKRCTAYVDIPKGIAVGLAVGRHACNLKTIMGVAECVVVRSDRLSNASREVKVVASDRQKLDVVVEKLQTLFGQLYPMGPSWCHFHSGGIATILGNGVLEFRAYKGRQPVYIANWAQMRTLYEVCLCQVDKTQHNQDTSLGDLERLNPSSSPLETVDSLHFALDSLYGPDSKKKFSVDEMAKAAEPTNRARIMIEYKAHIIKKLREALNWMLKNRKPLCTARLEARFGKLLWFYLPDDVLACKEPWGVNKFAEFIFTDTNHSQLFNTDVRVHSDDLCSGLEAVTDPKSVVETLDVKFNAAKTKLDMRVKIGENGGLTIVAVKKNESKVVTFDIICLHRRHDIRLSLSQMEIVPPTDALYPLVQHLFETITFTEDPTTVTLVPCTEEWTVSFIRRKKRTTYVLEGKYMVTVSHIQEYRPNWEKLPKGIPITIKPEDFKKEHIEVEFHNIKWDITFGKDAGLSPEKSLLLHMDRPEVDPALLSSIAYPWDADTIVEDLEDVFEHLDTLNESLGEA